MGEWFVDNKLLTHFGEDKTKCILFSGKKNLRELNVTYDNNIIKQFRIVNYLSCHLDANLSGESLTMRSLQKINTKLQRLYRQNEFLNPKLLRLLCNSFILFCNSIIIIITFVVIIIVICDLEIFLFMGLPEFFFFFFQLWYLNK